MKRIPLLTLNRSWLAVLVFLFLPGVNLFPLAIVQPAANHLPIIQFAPAKPGDLDLTFGDRGIVQADPGGSVAVQFNGKILVAGSTGDYLKHDFALARYNADGSIDAAFGNGGRIITDFDGRDDSANAVAIQPDGKILVAGSSDSSIALARYSSKGDLDPAFGESGKVLPGREETGGILGIDKVVFQPDGKIIAGGNTLRSYYEDVALVRFNQNGSLDPTFGNLGTFILQVEDNSRLSDMLVEPDGHIVVVGAAAGKYSRTRPAYLARITPDGNLVHLIPFDFPLKNQIENIHYNEANGVAWQSNGKLIVAGNTADLPNGLNELALARFAADGVLDPSFGDGGFINLSGPFNTWGSDIKIQRDGKLLVSGNIENPSGGTDFLLARFTPDGALDPTFGEGGLSRVNADALDYEGSQIILLRDGRILLAGRTYTERYTEQHFILARLLNDAPALVPLVWFPVVGHP